MKIQKKDLFHGAALTQITEHTRFTALNTVRDGKYGHYLINTDVRVLLKHSGAGGDHWPFTFNPAELVTLLTDFQQPGKTFAVLVCGETTICALDESQLRATLDFDTKKAQGLGVTSPAGKQMAVKGFGGALAGKIPHNAFPDVLFS